MHGTFRGCNACMLELEGANTTAAETILTGEQGGNGLRPILDAFGIQDGAPWLFPHDCAQIHSLVPLSSYLIAFD